MKSTRLLALTLIIGIAACGGNAPTDVAEPVAEESTALVVFTVNYPLAYFAERIGGDLVEVRFPAPADEDPAYWSPDADTIASYQTADLILLNGADYAKWIDRATLPASKMVDTSLGFSDQLLPLEGSTTHSHGPEGEHQHTGWAFTTWLDPELAIEQARAVGAVLAKALPEHRGSIETNLTVLEGELLELDGRIAAAAELIGESPIFFSHPVYQYLIARYELNGVQVHWEPDEAPDGAAWDHLEELLASHQARWMLWEGEPLENTVSGLDELGIGSLLFDPCSNAPETGNFMTVMAANAGSLETIAETLNGN